MINSLILMAKHLELRDDLRDNTIKDIPPASSTNQHGYLHQFPSIIKTR